MVWKLPAPSGVRFLPCCRCKRGTLRAPDAGTPHSSLTPGDVASWSPSQRHGHGGLIQGGGERKKEKGFGGAGGQRGERGGGDEMVAAGGGPAPGASGTSRRRLPTLPPHPHGRDHHGVPRARTPVPPAFTSRSGGFLQRGAPRLPTSRSARALPLPHRPPARAAPTWGRSCSASRGAPPPRRPPASSRRRGPGVPAALSVPVRGLQRASGQESGAQRSQREKKKRESVSQTGRGGGGKCKPDRK